MEPATKKPDQFANIVKDIKGELGQKILEKFSKLMTTESRFQFVWNLSSVHKILGARSCLREKNGDIAQTSRKQGNVLFQKKQYQEAIEHYNQSVIHAPAEDDCDREELTLALANRSASLYHLQQYQRCIDDIEYALEMGYPENLRYKLYDRLGRCYIALEDRANAVGYLKKAGECVLVSDLNDKGKQVWQQSLAKLLRQAEQLKELSHNNDTGRRRRKVPPEIVNRSPEYPCVSAAFGVHYSADKGRYVRAKEDIKVGDVILVEKSYSSVLISEHLESHCNHCLLRIMVPFPCMRCTSVRYCSPACQHQAQESYHHAECSLMGWLTEEWMGQMSYLALRTVLVTDIKTLIHNYQKPGQSTMCEKQPVKYENIWHLLGHVEKHSQEQLFQLTVMAVLTVKLLQLTDYWPDQHTDIAQSSDDLLLALGCSVIELLCIVQCNAFNIAEMQVHSDFRLCKPRDIGLGLYPTAALMNHACCPNVDVNYYGDTNVYQAIQNIKAGEEINVDYGVVFYTNPRLDRHSKLSDQYFFTCQCQACTEDWPLAEQLNSSRPVFLCRCGAQLNAVCGVPGAPVGCKQCGADCDIVGYLQDLQQSHTAFTAAMTRAMEGHHQEALPILQAHMDLLQSRIAAPWRDFFTCQATIKQCYSLMGNTSTDNAL